MLKLVSLFYLARAGGTGVAFDTWKDGLNNSWINLWQKSEEKKSLFITFFNIWLYKLVSCKKKFNFQPLISVEKVFMG